MYYIALAIVHSWGEQLLNIIAYLKPIVSPAWTEVLLSEALEKDWTGSGSSPAARPNRQILHKIQLLHRYTHTYTYMYKGVYIYIYIYVYVITNISAYVYAYIHVLSHEHLLNMYIYYV